MGLCLYHDYGIDACEAKISIRKKITFLNEFRFSTLFLISIFHKHFK